MKNWTTQAERRLEEYLQQRAARERLTGEDAAELKEDLRRHVFEEAEKFETEGLSLMQLEHILGGMDAGYRWVRDHESSEIGEEGRWRKSPWLFGVFFPILVLLIELVSSFCGSVFFDPIPTLWHVALVALVPALNAWLLKGAPGANDRWKGFAVGVVLVISGFYGLLFLPLLLWSLLALILVGMGMLSLTPIFAWAASWRIGVRVGKNSNSPAVVKRGRWLGMAAAVLALLVLEGPASWTRANIHSALSQENNAAAIARLRFFSSERTLLKACYEQQSTDIPAWISSSGDIFMGERQWRRDLTPVRDLFFRVTGKPFNSLTPPRNGGSGFVSRGDSRETIEFDDSVAGDQVAMRLRSLNLAESRFDGHFDSVSRIGYGEWTMVFRNRSASAKEARCQVKLPRDGRVSRLTLWVDGEPREAAFSTVSKVKAAYKQVAVVQRRDPVLVTMTGPDTVLVQCFPVPAHGEMKIRFGVTAPLEGGRWEMPAILEQNFGMIDGLEQSIWLQGDRGFELKGTEKPVVAIADGAGKSLSISLPAASSVKGGLALVTEKLAAEAPVVWCEDPFAKDAGHFLIRESKITRTPGSGKVVMVIDGSLSLAAAKDRLVNSLDEHVIAVLADDGARRIDAAALAKYRFSGGRDNGPALREAVRISRENGALPIVWVHGPQAVKFGKIEALLQVLERGAVAPLIYTVEVAPGANRLLEAIYRNVAIKSGPRLDEGFSQFLTEIEQGAESSGWVWRRSSDAAEMSGSKVWDQLARYWAAGAAEDPKQEIVEASRSEMAAHYQLVTPVSGAVVLETMQQYASNGLAPIDADSAPHIPIVPEPSTGVLVILTVTAGLLRRKRAA